MKVGNILLHQVLQVLFTHDYEVTQALSLDGAYPRFCKRVSWSNDLCVKVLDDRMFDTGSKNAGAGRKKAVSCIDLWQSEVDEPVNAPVGAHGERDAGT